MDRSFKNQSKITKMLEKKVDDIKISQEELNESLGNI